MLLLFSAIANPLGSAIKVWHPERLIEQNTPTTNQPIPTPPQAPQIKQPTVKTSKFWHAKLNPNLPPKLERLETQLRQTYTNANITISSGYRSKRYNAQLGRRLGFTHNGGRVARNSAHTQGKAADLYAYQMQNGEKYIIPHKIVAQHAKEIFQKILVYNDHIHVEIQ